MYKRDLTAEDIEGLTYAKRAGVGRIKVRAEDVGSYEVRRYGVVIVNCYGYFTRNQHDAWDGYVWRPLWGVKKSGGEKWFIDYLRKDALYQMENWCEKHRRGRGLCKCEKEAT